MIGAGSYSGQVANFFPGTIDELNIFDKRIAQSEVDTLYAKRRVGDPGRPAIAIFPMDETGGATELTAHGDVLPADFHGGVTAGSPGVDGNSITLNGNDGYARVASPHLNSSRSFSVSAWVKIDHKTDVAAIIAAQTGNERPGFELYYSASYDRWVFNQYDTDSAESSPVRAMAEEAGGVYPGSWAHLVGVHDTVADTLTLYVNGSDVGSTKLGGAFYAAGPLQIGAGNYSGEVSHFFPGQIDDVRLFDRPVSAEEVRQLYAQRPLVEGRWMFEQVASGTPATTPDDSAVGDTMSLYNGAKAGPGFIDFGGLELDGVDDYGATSAVPVDTTGSFTVTAWAQASSTPQDAVSLVSADGSRRSALSVRYVPDPTDPLGLGSWQLAVPDRDVDDASVPEVANGNFYDVRDWNHLAVVYDGFAKSVRLYVNGNLEEVACQDADGDGTADDVSCTDLVPWAENALSFKATGSLQVGRAKTAGAWGEYFPGRVDDVWAFQGALTDAQIEKLASSWFDVPTKVPGD